MVKEGKGEREGGGGRKERGRWREKREREVEGERREGGGEREKGEREREREGDTGCLVRREECGVDRWISHYLLICADGHKRIILAIEIE